MTGTGIGPHGISEEQKRKIIATREGQIANGGYAFGARVNALVAASASSQTIELVRNVVRAANPRRSLCMASSSGWLTDTALKKWHRS